MKLRVAYNQHGEILAATEGGSQADLNSRSARCYCSGARCTNQV